MDIFEEIKKRQAKFLEKPRESIKKLISETDNFAEGLAKLGLTQNRPDLLLTYKNFHKQYSDLIGKLLEKRLISAKSFKDDKRDGSVIQAVKEMERSVKSHQEKTIPKSEDIPLLKISNASILEILWAKLKRIIFLSGLNPQEKYLNLPNLEKKVEELENQYSIDLSLIKDILKGELRNPINHEHTHFEEPNFLVFTKEVNGKWKEYERITDEELIEKMLKSFLILTTLHHVETTVIASHLEPLLKLNDSQLEEYCKTGVLTEDMDKTIREEI